MLFDLWPQQQSLFENVKPSFGSHWQNGHYFARTEWRWSLICWELYRGARLGALAEAWSLAQKLGFDLAGKWNRVKVAASLKTLLNRQWSEHFETHFLPFGLKLMLKTAYLIAQFSEGLSPSTPALSCRAKNLESAVAALGREETASAILDAL